MIMGIEFLLNYMIYARQLSRSVMNLIYLNPVKKIEPKHNFHKIFGNINHQFLFP